MTAAPILGLLPEGVRVASDPGGLRGPELLGASESQLQAVRGRMMPIVSQNAVASLNPLIPVGDQVRRCGTSASTPASARAHPASRCASLYRRSASPRRPLARAYPHHFSGGMAQRVAIAMALISGLR